MGFLFSGNIVNETRQIFFAMKGLVAQKPLS